MHLHVPFSQLACQHTVANSVSPFFTAVEWFSECACIWEPYPGQIPLSLYQQVR